MNYYLSIGRVLFRFVIILVFLTTHSSFCLGQKFSLGVKGGLLMDWAHFGDKDEKDIFSSRPAPGYQCAMLIGFPLKNNYSFFTEAGFSQKGRILKFNEDTWTNKSTYYFLDFSMVLRKSYVFQFEKNIPAKWFFNIGPEINYWLSGKGNVSVEGPGYDYTLYFDQAPDGSFDKMFLQDVNRWLFGLIAGVGFEAPLRNNKRLLTELRFTSGHTFLSKQEGFDPNNYPVLGFQDTQRVNLKVLSLSVAYILDLDKKQMRKGKSTKDKEIKRRRG